MVSGVNLTVQASNAGDVSNSGIVVIGVQDCDIDCSIRRSGDPLSVAVRNKVYLTQTHKMMHYCASRITYSFMNSLFSEFNDTRGLVNTKNICVSQKINNLIIFMSSHTASISFSERIEYLHWLRITVSC